MPVTPAAAQDLHGLFNSSFSTTSTESSAGTSTDFQSARQSLDVNWNKVISPFLSYRLTLRAEDTESATTVQDGEVTESTQRLLQPALDLTLAAPGYSFNTGVRARELFTEGSDQPAVRVSDRNVFARLFYRPEGLPSLAFLVDRTTSVDDRSPRTRDTEDTRYQINSQYLLRDLSLAYTFTRQIKEDNVAERTQTRQSHSGNAGYTGKFFRDRLAVQGNGTVNYTETREEFFVAGTAELARGLRRGLRAAADATPLSSADVPLADEPGLVTGTANVPLDLLVAVGFELAARQAIAEIELALAPQPPFSLPANLTNFVAFRVFFTDDATLVAWTEAAGVSQTFDPALSRLTLSFPATTARFFKVYVSRNDFGPLVRVTGLTSRDTVPITAGTERVTSSLNTSVSGGLTFTPIKELSASYNVSLNQSRQDPDAVESTSGTHVVSVTGQPHRLLTATGTYQYSFSDTNQPGALGTTASAYSFTLGSSPLPTLTTSLALARNENRTGGELQNRSDAASLSAAARVFPQLNLEPAYTVTKAQDFVNNRTTLSHGVSVNATAQLTPRISTVATYSFQYQETTPPLAESAAQATSHTIGGATTYTFSRVVNFTTRFDVVTTSAGTFALAQQYKLDWVPTAKTSFFVSYRTTQQEAGDISSTSDSVSLNGRWNVSRYLDLSADYSFSRAVAGTTEQSTQSVNVSAGVRF